MARAEPAAYNILLDPLPDHYEGWLIRTDYRIAIQLMLCLEDEDLTSSERIYVALSLLYGNGIPPSMDTALDGLRWFLRCGEPERENTQEKRLLYLDFDHARIMASFRKTYGIELHRARLHWFEFSAMLDCLDEDSSLSNAIQVRGTDTSDMKGKQRAVYDRLKKNMLPPTRYSEEEQDAIDAFFSQLDS